MEERQDLISRQAAIDALSHMCSEDENGITVSRANVSSMLRALPSAQPELTDDRAIEYLQSTGWMQNHDKEMYEMGLRKRLADDSGSYDSLIPSGDTILRQAAIDALKEHRALYCDNTPDTFSKLSYAEKSRVDELDTAIATLVNLPSAEPERKKGKWIRTRTVEHDGELYCDQCGQEHPEQKLIWNYCPNCGADMRWGQE